jgi:hypothetical protein
LKNIFIDLFIVQSKKIIYLYIFNFAQNILGADDEDDDDPYEFEEIRDHSTVQNLWDPFQIVAVKKYSSLVLSTSLVGNRDPQL